MQKTPLSSRGIFGGSESLLIEALAPAEGGAHQFQPIVFRGAQVACIHGVSENISVIILQNGITIPVALAFQELKRQVYEPDIKTGSHLDLTLMTGQAARDAQKVTLAMQFNPEAENPLPDFEKELQIMTYVEDSNGREIFSLSIPESQIQYYKVSEKNPEKTYIRLIEGKIFTRTNQPDCYINLPLAELQDKILKARRLGLETLDLTAETRQRTPRISDHRIC